MLPPTNGLLVGVGRSWMEDAGWRMEVNLERPRITLASSPITF